MKWIETHYLFPELHLIWLISSMWLSWSYIFSSLIHFLHVVSRILHTQIPSHLWLLFLSPLSEFVTFQTSKWQGVPFTGALEQSINTHVFGSCFASCLNAIYTLITLKFVSNLGRSPELDTYIYESVVTAQLECLIVIIRNSNDNNNNKN